MTNFPGGIQGSPVIGANHFGWKHKSAHASRVWVVDGISGHDGAEGDSPDTALATVGRAIFLASAYDVIYILDKGFADTDPVAYRETAAAGNLSIAYAKSHLALVGVPHNIHDVFGLQIKAALTLHTPIITVNAPCVAIENLDINGTGDDLAYGNVYFHSEGSTTYQAEGCSVYNCHIRNGKGSAGVATEGGGVVIHGGWYNNIIGNRFENCRVGVRMVSAAGTVKGTRIERNVFTGDITLIDCDIYMQAGGGSVITHSTVCGNYFAHDVGSYGYNKYACLHGDGGLLDNYFAHFAVEAKADGADIVVPLIFRMAGNFDEAGLILRAA